ncbi:hypothetical protein Glove_360g51 [Diversispora epigaea]|uniref:Uncharacterized protein n=1 Tax=Diversispora epigaea TaxID=1348612 RepID=A0A397HE90_9GLOM|nr:hypothetical protein Glove_360g51 [Diversispora epigaea]
MTLTSKKNSKNPTKSDQKSPRGRKAFTTPEKLDLTGKNHIMIVRRVPNNSSKKKKNNLCINCDSSDQYTELISQNIDRIENLVKNLGKVVSKEQKPKEISINKLDNLDFTKMDTDTLIKCSTLFNTQSLQPQPQPQPYVQSFSFENLEDENLEQTLQINDDFDNEISINKLDNLDFTKMDTDTLIKCSTLFNTQSLQPQPQPQPYVQSFSFENLEDENLEQTLQINDDFDNGHYWF